MFLKQGEDDIMIKQAELKQQEAKEKEEYKKSKTNSKRKNVNSSNTDKTKCKHCGNYHLGEYCLKDTVNDLMKGGKGNPPKNKGTGNPKKNKSKKPKIADQLQKLTKTVQSMNSNKSRPSWGTGMDAEEYKAIILSLAMDNACTLEQVLTLPINNEMLACHKAAYKSIN